MTIRMYRQLAKKNAMSNAARQCEDRGFTREKKKDRHGAVRTGWWSGEHYLSGNPAEAIRLANGS